MAGEYISVQKVRGILMVTVPPDPDDATIGALQDQVLAAMEKHGSRGLVMDISTVETLDSFFARTIVENRPDGGPDGRSDRFGRDENRVWPLRPLNWGLTLGGLMTALNVERALDLLEDQGPGYDL